jgi:hypothetical protein
MRRLFAGTDNWIVCRDPFSTRGCPNHWDHQPAKCQSGSRDIAVILSQRLLRNTDLQPAMPGKSLACAGSAICSVLRGADKSLQRYRLIVISRRHDRMPIIATLHMSRSEYHRLREKNIAQMGSFVYCLLAPEETIDAEPRLEAD